MFRNTWNQRTNPTQYIWRVWDQNLGKKKILKFFHFDNLICILWSNLEVRYDSGSLVSCWHMSRGQPSQTVLKSVHSLALYDFLKFYLIYYPTAPLNRATFLQVPTVPWNKRDRLNLYVENFAKSGIDYIVHGYLPSNEEH